MDPDSESRTLWCGNLSDKVTEEVLFELFLQVAPLEDLRIPTDKTGRRANYAFVVVKHQVSVDYVIQMLHGTPLYDRELTIKPRNTNKRNNFNASNDGIIINELMGSLLVMPWNNVSPPTQSYPSPYLNNRGRSRGKPYQRHDEHQGRSYRGRNDSQGRYNNRKRRQY